MIGTESKALIPGTAKQSYDIKSILVRNMSVTALILALILGGIIMFICGYNPLDRKSVV